MIFIYVLKSLKKEFRYVGITNNLEKRLGQHNDGKNKSTKFYLPFAIILKEEYPDYKTARRREKFLKSGEGRAQLDALLIK